MLKFSKRRKIYQCSFYLLYFQVLQLKDFKDLVKADAAEVQDRQETDSIDIIDSIRFHLTSFIQTYSEMQESEDKLKELDDFLMSLGLEC